MWDRCVCGLSLVRVEFVIGEGGVRLVRVECVISEGGVCDW